MYDGIFQWDLNKRKKKNEQEEKRKKRKKRGEKLGGTSDYRCHHLGHSSLDSYFLL